MSEDNDGYHPYVVKDFKVPSPNGQMYDVDDERSLKAIENVCKRPCLYGEFNHPNVSQFTNLEDKIRRCSEIALERSAVVVRDLSYNKEDKTLTGMIKPIGSVFPHLLESLNEGKVVFGMRALVKGFPLGDKGIAIDSIVTFDIISPG